MPAALLAAVLLADVSPADLVRDLAEAGDGAEVAAEKLVRIGPPAVPALVAGFHRATADDDPTLSARIVVVLEGMTDGAGCGPALVKLLAAQDSDTRAAVCDLLSMLPATVKADPKRLDALAGRLKDPDVYVRRHAARALGRLGTIAKPVRDAMQAAARDDADEGVRKAAAEAAEAVGRPEKGT